MVTHVGRLVPVKAQDVLVSAASKVLESLPDARFVIIGGGPLHDQLARQIEEAGIQDKFFLLGWRTDIPDVLAASDLFALTSLQEGMPLAILEAMSAGCPVVATEVGGIPEVVRDGITGLLVPPGDADALAEAILKILTDPERAKELAARGQRLVEHEYSTQAWARRWEALYLRELGRVPQSLRGAGLN
jgi:glycosyltransferase involved in cell wall biosynthesis